MLPSRRDCNRKITKKKKIDFFKHILSLKMHVSPILETPLSIDT